MRAHVYLMTMLLGACAGDAVDDPCQAAADHLAQCLGAAPAGFAEQCDVDDAEAIVTVSCADLGAAVDGADTKADGGGFFGRTACRMGFYAACQTPMCMFDPAIEAPTASDECSEWLRYGGCGACEYYRCREVLQPCGADGYLLGYAGKYCDRYASVTEPRTSAAAAAWLKKVRHCLVERFEETVPLDASCEAVWELGTASHLSCYLETGFCDLGPREWLAVLHSIDLSDLPLRTMLATGSACLRSWLAD